MAGIFDLNLYRGDSYTWRFVLWADENRTEPVDLSDATVEAEIREKSAGVSITSLDCAITLPNVIDVSVTPVMYLTIPAKAMWDLELTFDGTRVHTPIKGAVAVTPDVTGSLAIPIS